LLILGLPIRFGNIKQNQQITRNDKYDGQSFVLTGFGFFGAILFSIFFAFRHGLPNVWVLPILMKLTETAVCRSTLLMVFLHLFV
jgi:hypothetical protein